MMKSILTITAGFRNETMEVPDNHPGCSAPLPSFSETHYTSSTYGWQWPSYPLYPSYPHPPVSTNPLPQAPVYNFSGCTVYLGSNEVRHHRNDIVLAQRILDIHMNVYHAMYRFFMYHTVMCRRYYRHIILFYTISWMYYYDTVVATIMISN